MTTTLATPTYTIECPICGAVTTGAPAKYIHRCDVRGERGKLLSREWIGYFEGMPVCYKDDGREAQRELDAYVYDLLSRTAAETTDIAADAAAELSTEAPLLVAASAKSVSWCYVCNAAAWNWDEHGPLCPSHFNAPQADPPLDPAPQLGRRDHGSPGRRACILCDGDHPAEICPLIRLAPLTCGGCGAPDHGIQTCPAVRALLFAPTTSAERMAARVDPQLLARAVAA